MINQMFRDYREKLNHKLSGTFQLPWMKSKEFDIIKEILLRLDPAECFEWGSGMSTLVFPRLAGRLQSWTSIEHNKEWFEFISRKNQEPKVTLELVLPDNQDFKIHDGKSKVLVEGSYDDFRTYVDYPRTLNRLFDFIFIDGRARRFCLRTAFDLIKDNGVVVVHDANRDDYFVDLPPFKSVLKLNDYRKRRKLGGIWVGRKAGSIDGVLDVGYHENLWRKHDQVARYFFLR